MAERRINRRNLLVSGSMTALGALELGQVYAFQHPYYHVTGAVLNELDKLSGDLVDRIDVTSFNKPSLLSDNAERVLAQRAALATTLMQLSFIGGGFDEANIVHKFIKARGLEVWRAVLPSNLGGAFLRSAAVGSSARVFLAERVIDRYFDPNLQHIAERTVFHEFQHVIQQARDPQRWEIEQGLEDICEYTIIASFGSRFGMELNNRIPRRNVITLGLGVGAGGMLGYLGTVVNTVTGNLASTRELEAYERSEVVRDRMILDEVNDRLFVRVGAGEGI